MTNHTQPSRAIRNIDEFLRDAEHGFISVADVIARIQETTGVTRKDAASFLSHLQSKSDFPPFVLWGEDRLIELTDLTDGPWRIAGALAAAAVGKPWQDSEDLLTSGGFDENQIFPILQAIDARITRRDGILATQANKQGIEDRRKWKPRAQQLAMRERDNEPEIKQQALGQIIVDQLKREGYVNERGGENISPETVIKDVLRLMWGKQ